MRKTDHATHTRKGSTGYSQENHKLLEASYREAFQHHQKCREAANVGIRDLRASERRLASAAQAFVEHTNLKMALLPAALCARLPDIAETGPTGTHIDPES